MIRLSTGERCLEFGAIDSTNAEARRLAARGDLGPVWIRAECQTAGRGRRGRKWISRPGNLFATHLHAPRRAAAERAQLSFVAAVALHDALYELTGGKDFFCKWPNDLLIGERKLAGILLESEGDWVATGIGINLVSAPEAVERPATSLFDAFGVTLSTRQVLESLAESFAVWRARWEAGGFPPVREAWLARTRGLGETAVIHVSDRRFTGRLCDLGSDGALLVEEVNGRMMRITAGDVFPDVQEV